MKHLCILPDAQWAGHCTSGKSNKVWAACLAIEREEEAPGPSLSTLPPTTEVVVLCGYGPSGAALRLQAPQQRPIQAARTLLQKKWQEKRGKGYQPVAFEPFVPSFGHPRGLPLSLPGSGSPLATNPETLAPPETLEVAVEETLRPWRHTATLVKAVTYDGMLALLSMTREGKPSSYAISEKANGHRCLVEFDGRELRAYNRKGQRTSAPPEGARAFCRIGHSFVLDGERLIRDQAGHFVVFDVLEWDGESVLTQPYRLRMSKLVHRMQAVGLLKEKHITATYRQAQANSTVPGVCVLLAIPGTKQAQVVLKEIQEAGGEGVVIRNLDALYAESGFKYKFLEDIDAFVIGIAPGVSAGSLTLGLVRPADGAILEVGHVRSGLNDREVEAVRDLLAQGQLPVFKISYLPASTTGISLVQPQTSMQWLRHDKEARD